MLAAYAAGKKYVDIVDVHSACLDMEGSTDGFHYFKFVKENESLCSIKV